MITDQLQMDLRIYEQKSTSLHTHLRMHVARWLVADLDSKPVTALDNGFKGRGARESTTMHLVILCRAVTHDLW
jgi:hypothetical protein